VLVNSDQARRWLPVIARRVLVNLDRARRWLLGIMGRLLAYARGALAHRAAARRWLCTGTNSIMVRTARPRRRLAARVRPLLARLRPFLARLRPLLDRLRPLLDRLEGPRRAVAASLRPALARLDRFQPWLPGVSRRAILGLVLIAQLAWPAVFHAADAGAQPAQVPAAKIAAGQPTPAGPAAPASPPPGAHPGDAAATPAAVPAAVPTPAELMPEGMPVGQSTYIPTIDQMDNARAIIGTGQQLSLPPRAWVIAVATSLQETNLHNYGNLGGANDHDSLGLFQQRPSSGWGTPDQLVDPHYAAAAFYNALLRVPGWQSAPLTVAAQDVQVSAFGDRYAQWEKQATDMVLATYGIGPYWDVAP
jgi:hypothetical protein